MPFLPPKQQRQNTGDTLLNIVKSLLLLKPQVMSVTVTVTVTVGRRD